MPAKTLRAPDDVLAHLRAARDLADREYAQPVDLDRLAATAGLSKYHFLRLFRATYGLTPGSTSPSAGSSGPRTCCVPPTSP